MLDGIDRIRNTHGGLPVRYQYRSISLVGTQVHMKGSGSGIVIQHDVNLICVRFGNVEKQYFISKKFPMRPTFEDDAEIVDAMTEYEAKLRELDVLKKKRSAMQ